MRRCFLPQITAVKFLSGFNWATNPTSTAQLQRFLKPHQSSVFSSVPVECCESGEWAHPCVLGLQLLQWVYTEECVGLEGAGRLETGSVVMGQWGA